MALFFAYVGNIESDAVSRMVLIFQDSATADEWWRAVSGSTVIKDVQRTSPQFYTHKPSVYNLYYFFTDTNVTALADPFRGRLILTWERDRTEQGGMSIIPSQNVTDLVSGNWFYIRSKSHPSTYWYFDPNTDRVYASDTDRTLFSVTAQSLPAGTIIIDSDTVALKVSDQLYIDIDNSGNVIGGTAPWSFLFGDLADGRFISSGTGSLVFENVDAGSPKKAGWELV